MQQKVTKNWVTIGTGVIANELAVAMESLNGKLYGVANRTSSDSDPVLCYFLLHTLYLQNSLHS